MRERAEGPANRSETNRTVREIVSLALAVHQAARNALAGGTYGLVAHLSLGAAIVATNGALVAGHFERQFELPARWPQDLHSDEIWLDVLAYCATHSVSLDSWKDRTGRPVRHDGLLRRLRDAARILAEPEWRIDDREGFARDALELSSYVIRAIIDSLQAQCGLIRPEQEIRIPVSSPIPARFEGR